MKRKENIIKTNLTKLEEEIENKKKLPKEEKKKILKKCLINGIISIILIVYLVCLQIGELNIETITYITILKVLSVVLIIGTIIMFEISYKTNRNEIILHSIELMFLCFFTLFLIPAYSLYYGSFYKVIIAYAIVMATYYLLKCAIIMIKSKKQHNKNLTDIKTIVAK